MRRSQALGLVLVVVGLLILVLLRDPLYQFIVVVVQLLFIFIGFVLVVVGVGMLVGGRAMRRGPWWFFRGTPTFPS